MAFTHLQLNRNGVGQEGMHAYHRNILYQFESPRINQLLTNTVFPKPLFSLLLIQLSSCLYILTVTIYQKEKSTRRQEDITRIQICFFRESHILFSSLHNPHRHLTQHRPPSNTIKNLGFCSFTNKLTNLTRKQQKQRSAACNLAEILETLNV